MKSEVGSQKNLQFDFSKRFQISDSSDIRLLTSGLRLPAYDVADILTFAHTKRVQSNLYKLTGFICKPEMIWNGTKLDTRIDCLFSLPNTFGLNS